MQKIPGKPLLALCNDPFLNQLPERMQIRWSAFSLGILVLAAACVRANVTLPPLFSDHGVLQRSAHVPNWGRTFHGERVSVTLANTHAQTVAGPDGQWRVALDLHAAGKDPTDLIVEGNNRLEIPDIVVGEDWVCSGQSNMWLSLESTTHGVEEVAASANPSIRVYDADNPICNLYNGAGLPAGPFRTDSFPVSTVNARY